MNGQEKNIIGKIRVNELLTAVLEVVISVLILLLEMNMRTAGFSAAFRDFMAQPKLWAVNLFPVLCVTAAFTSLFRNAFYGGALSSFVFGALSYANLLKIEGRADPLVPGDLMLLREALDAVGEYRLELHPAKFIPALLFTALLVYLGVRKARAKKLAETDAPAAQSETRNGKTSLLSIPLARGFASCVIILAVLAYMVTNYYTNTDRYYRFETPERYNVALEFETLGFNYCFLYNWNLYPVDKPEGYNKAEVERWNAEGVGFELGHKMISQDQAEPIPMANIIIVMGEAFSDLSDEAPFAYTEENDPLKSYKKVCASENAVSGHIAVSNYAAGTANTEFNVMTGMQTNMIGEGLTSSFRVIRKPTDNIFTVLNSAGYEGFFMHPGKSWFYNRSSVFNRFGISDQVFEEAFDESDKKGTMISDAAFLEELKADLQTRMMENDAPLFVYSTTIENHQAYNYGKFGDIGLPEVPLKKEVQPVTKERLEVYMEGVRDNADMILELAEWLDTVDEPTIMVFFGDHRPNLGDSYDDLGLSYMTAAKNDTPENTISTYLTPFVIRVNKAYAEAVDVQAVFESLELARKVRSAGRTLDGPVISDNYIPSILLEMTGLTGRDAFFDQLSVFRRSVPVYRDDENAYLLADGTYSDSPELPVYSSFMVQPEISETLRRLHWWTYYRIKQ
jgi:hypothetical protein